LESRKIPIKKKKKKKENWREISEKPSRFKEPRQLL